MGKSDFAERIWPPLRKLVEQMKGMTLTVRVGSFFSSGVSLDMINNSSLVASSTRRPAA